MVESFCERLISYCKGISGVIGIAASGQAVLRVTIVCSDLRARAVTHARVELAQAAGRLLSCTSPGPSSLRCLYAASPHRVDYEIVMSSRLRGLSSGERILWEWNGALSSLGPQGGEPPLRRELQVCENSFWLLQYEAAALAQAGELAAAFDAAWRLYKLCLLPVWRAAGRDEGQLLPALPSGSAGGVAAAVSKCGELYFALRYELADEEFIRRDEAEELAREAVDALVRACGADRP